MLGLTLGVGSARAQEAPPEATAVVEPPEAPAPEGYRPLLSFGFGPDAQLRLTAPISVASRFEGFDAFAVDRDGTELDGATLNSQLRIGLTFDTGRAVLPFILHAEYEHDVLTGPLVGRTELEGARLPESQDFDHELRKAYGRASFGRYAHLSVGATVNHFGLGLVSNGGTNVWTPGSALFNDPRGGDRVLRAALATGPYTDGQLFAALAFDQVVADDVTVDGDTARQVSVALLYGREQPNSAGIFVTRRGQDADDGTTLDVTVIDAFGRARFELGGPELTLTVEGEAALILGKTSFAATGDVPEQDVRQLGAVLRATLAGRVAGGVLDLFYGSGDANLTDETQSAFKADPNYALGLIMFRQVLGAQTGRAAATAGDPNLVGRPPQGVDRFASRGAPTGAFVVFPRGYVRPFDGFEAYGGPLFAFSSADLADPLNTQIAGGVPRNALDGQPGGYLGTELDLGVRYSTLLGGTDLTVGLEGGIFFPGNAFATATGDTLGRVIAGRALFRYRL